MKQFSLAVRVSYAGLMGRYRASLGLGEVMPVEHVCTSYNQANT